MSNRILNLIKKCEGSYIRAILPAKFALYFVSHDNRWMEFFLEQIHLAFIWLHVLTAGDSLAVHCSWPHLRQRLARSPELYQFLCLDVLLFIGHIWL
jgi:hypothetical protein